MEKMTVVNGETPANAYFMNKLQDNVEDAINETIKTSKTVTHTSGYSCNYINECNTYSTNETLTGKTWIDGKPIYRKVILFTTSTTLNQWSTYQHNISNIDTILPNWELKIKYLNHWYNTPNDIVIETRVNNTDIGYYITNSGFAGQQAMVILEYTKTTD